MKIEDFELHDALLKSTIIDYASKVIEVQLELYLSTKDSNRQPFSIIFEEAESISQISDLGKIKQNAFAGNVNYWLPEQNGTTYIYLTDGCIAIKSAKLRAKE